MIEVAGIRALHVAVRRGVMSSQEELRRPPVLQITPSERKALQLLAVGAATDEVATSLGVGRFDLESALAVLFAAMGASSPSEAIAEAEKRGLLPTTTARDDVDSGARRSTNDHEAGT